MSSLKEISFSKFKPNDDLLTACFGAKKQPQPDWETKIPWSIEDLIATTPQPRTETSPFPTPPLVLSTAKPPPPTKVTSFPIVPFVYTTPKPRTEPIPFPTRPLVLTTAKPPPPTEVTSFHTVAFVYTTPKTRTEPIPFATHPFKIVLPPATTIPSARSFEKNVDFDSIKPATKHGKWRKHCKISPNKY